MTDRAEPGVTPQEPSRGTICRCGAAKGYHGPAFGSDHEYEPLYPARRIIACTIPEHAALDAATPRPGLVEAATRVLGAYSDADGGVIVSGVTRSDEQFASIRALRAALHDHLDVERAIGDALDTEYVADLFGGPLESGEIKLLSRYLARAIALPLANDKGADPTPEPK